MYIVNPNAPEPRHREEPELPAGERAELAETVERLVREWPGTDELGEPIPYITLHELTVATRRFAAAAAKEIEAVVREANLARGQP